MYKLTDLMTFFGLSERSIRRHLQQGILKGPKIKGTWYFSEEDIENYMNNEISFKQITKAHHTNLERFINGFKTPQESTCLLIDIKEEANEQLRELSEYMSTMKDKFDFSALTQKDYTRIIFIGSFTDAHHVMNYIKEHYETV